MSKRSSELSAQEHVALEAALSNISSILLDKMEDKNVDQQIINGKVAVKNEDVEVVFRITARRRKNGVRTTANGQLTTDNRTPA